MNQHNANDMLRGWHAARRGEPDDPHADPDWRRGWRYASPPLCGDPDCEVCEEDCAGAAGRLRFRRAALRTGTALALAAAAALIGRHVLQLDMTLPYVVAGILAERASWSLVP